MQVKNLITYTLKLKNIRVQLNKIQAETEKHTHSIQGTSCMMISFYLHVITITHMLVTDCKKGHFIK